VRTQRDRFWQEDAAAFNTLFTVLERVTRLAAPLLPLEAEEIWRGLTGGRSVHLTDYPTAPSAWDAPEVAPVMDTVREIVSAAHALRKREQIRVRQPLTSLEVAVEDPRSLQPFVELIASELNVKFVVGVTPAAFVAANPVERRLTVNARAAGPRIGKQVQQAIAGSKSGDWSETPDGVVTGGVALQEGEFELTTVIGGEGVVASVLRGVNGQSGGFVMLDTEITPALEAEGFARDLIRTIQDERKNAGLNVGDRIALSLTVPAERVGAVRTHEELIAREVLATSMSVAEGAEVSVSVAKA
jgi:isoleucyl-tRNA synthetase